MKVIDGGVTAAKGFEAAGAEAAIKYQNRKIWQWYTVRSCTRQQVLLLRMW